MERRPEVWWWSREEGAPGGAVPLFVHSEDLSLQEGPGGTGTGVCWGAAWQAVPETPWETGAQGSASRPCPARPSSALWHPWQLVNKQEAARACG